MDISEYQRLPDVEKKHWWYITVHKIVIDELRRTFPSVLLDEGCGTGGLTEELTRLGAVTGCDISSEALSRIPKDHKAMYVLSSVNSLPYSNECFDAVTSVSVLYHNLVKDYEAATEIARVLKPGGTAIVVLPAFQWLLSTHDQRVHTKKRYRLSEAEELLQTAGLTIQSSRYLFSALFPFFLLKHIVEKVIGSKKYVSDLYLPPHIINQIVILINQVELLITKKVKVPFGNSLVITARKNVH